MDGPVRVLAIDNLAVESARREVYRAMRRLFGFEIHVLVPHSWKETREPVACEPEEGNEIHLHQSRTLFGFRHQRVVYLNLPGILRRVRPHFILAVAQPESYAGAEVCLLRRYLMPDTRLGLFSSRNIDYSIEGFPYKFRFTHNLCDALSRKSAPEICFYRPRVADTLLAPYGRHLVYVPHMVDCTLFRRKDLSGTGEGPLKQTLALGYVGRLVREKGLFTLLEAILRLPSHVRLRIVGTGPAEPDLKTFVRENGLGGRVEFSLPIPYREVPALLNSLDMLVLPSIETKHWTELFGRILIEAMASEVPIVASRTGGIPEVVGDAGLLVRPEDSAELAGAIEYLVRDRAVRQELGKVGRERALRLYDVPVVAGIIGREIMGSLQVGRLERASA